MEKNEMFKMLCISKQKKIAVAIVLVLIVLCAVLIYLSRFDYWIGDYKYHFYLDSRKVYILDYRGEAEVLSIPQKVGPFSVGYIEPHIFDENEYIEEVVVGKNNGQVFFSNCKNLETISFEDNIKVLNYALSGCNKIKAVNFPEGIEQITMGFHDCMGLSDVYIPKSVVKISRMAFQGTQFEKNHLNDKYYVAGNDILVFCNIDLTDDVVIPDGIKNCCVYLIAADEYSDRKIYYPETLEYMEGVVFAEDTVFFGGEDFVEINIRCEGLIVAPDDSPMAKYCKENNLNFRPMTKKEEKEWREKTEAAASEITYQEE